MKKLLLACALSVATIAFAATDIAGIKFEDKISVANTDLGLNGAGLRAKFFLKVYAIGLYLPEKKTTTADVLAAKGAKRLHIVTLRDLTAEQFADALVEGIHKNLAENEVEPLKARIERFRATILALKEAPKGALVEIDWLPGVGTRLSFVGQKKGEDIPGEDFYNALLRIWLGDHPAQDDLKGALLGN